MTISRTFTYTSGAQLPGAQAFSVFTEDATAKPSDPVTVVVKRPATATWLAVGTQGGPTPLPVCLWIDPMTAPTLAPGNYQATITAQSPDATLAEAQVSLQVEPNPNAPKPVEVEVTTTADNRLTTITVQRRADDTSKELLITVNKSTVIKVNGVKQ